VGDNPAWCLPELDDAAWTPADLPSLLPLPEYPHRCWYRARFVLPSPTPDTGLGVLLGRIHTADETYLNGTRIGGEGRVGDAFVDIWTKRRVYALPATLLRPGTNVLAVRVQSSLANGGMADGLTRIAPCHELMAEATRRDMRRKLVEAFILGALAVILIFWTLLLFHSVRQPAYLAFGAFILLLASSYGLESLLWYETGLMTPIAQRIGIALMLLVPASLLVFITRLVGGMAARGADAGAALCALLATGYLLFGSLRLVHRVEIAWMAAVAAGVVALGRQAWRARVWRGSSAMRAVAFGVGAFIPCGFLDLVATRVVAFAPTFGLFLYVGLTILIASLAYALATRLHRLHCDLRHLSQQLLATQETERRRLATELHDGLAPTLAALKLDVQLLARQHGESNGAETSRIVDGLSRGIGVLRGLSHELHPSSIDQLGLISALEDLAGRVAAEEGWRLDLRLPESEEARADVLRIPRETRTSLYRVAQEALHNAAKHADAGDVRLELTYARDSVQLRVEDDGRGCQMQTAGARGGIGWVTMRERAESLGGRCRIDSAPGKGVRIEICIPLP